MGTWGGNICMFSTSDAVCFSVTLSFYSDFYFLPSLASLAGRNCFSFGYHHQLIGGAV